jgi:hypothetical protein
MYVKQREVHKLLLIASVEADIGAQVEKKLKLISGH